jgi:hypothetical protein
MNVGVYSLLSVFYLMKSLDGIVEERDDPAKCSWAMYRAGWAMLPEIQNLFKRICLAHDTWLGSKSSPLWDHNCMVYWNMWLFVLSAYIYLKNFIFRIYFTKYIPARHKSCGLPSKIPVRRLWSKFFLVYARLIQVLEFHFFLYRIT